MASGAKIPRHIAIIMDGNRRWAKQRLMPTAFGHRKGSENFGDVAQWCAARGVEYLTVYAFSTENWRRNDEEISALTDILKDAAVTKLPELIKHNMRLRVLGDIDRFAPSARDALKNCIKKSESNTGLNVNLCLSYGGRADIVYGVNKLISEGKTAVTEEDITDSIYTAGMPDPELLIRTGGEVRISNFLLWQCAYSEMYFTDKLWPDFDETELDKAIEWYSGRSRRFGGTEETK